ncbi:hypothetical protein SAMN05216567_13416 [Variovorax sp. OK605]|nr:hypothetical protein SAMN05216567_13416 [Variovorax sp. OK605]
MVRRHLRFRLRGTGGVLAALFITACGGGSGGGGIAFPIIPAAPAPAAPAPAPAPPAPPPPAPPAPAPATEPPPAPTPTTLSSSVSKLALSVNAPGVNAALTGTPRTITIANTGLYEAKAVTYSVSPALPAGTTITPAACGPIAAGSTCVLTVSPGATPTAAPSDIAPTPLVLTVQGENTAAVTSTISILGYGSVYQSGYLFAVDDTTPPTGSIGGKVAALSTNSGFQSFGGIGINTGGQSSTDGASNTAAIVAALGTSQGSLARTCTEKIDGRYTNWYLPAICELSSTAVVDVGVSCNGSTGGAIQNVDSNLVANGIIDQLQIYYWSSTEPALDPANSAYVYFVRKSPRGFSIEQPKNFNFWSRCIRAITN